MRFRCANRISVFLRSRRDCSKPSVPASERATSRACSWMSRGILRAGSFGQHCGLSGHTSQSSLLARYRSVLPRVRCRSFRAAFRPGTGRSRQSDHNESRCARRCHHLASIYRTQDMWRDALLLDQPVQHRSRPISSIPDKPLWLEIKTLFGPLDHGLCCADLGLANGAGCLDINDDAELHVDQIVVGVSKECRPLVRSGPLSRRIGWRDELRHNVAGGTPCRIIKGRQILLNRAAGPLRIAFPAPILPWDRALLIGVGLDQAGIDGKTFAPNQTCGNACFDDTLEHVTENISLAEALVARTRECRMTRDSVLDAELAETSDRRDSPALHGRAVAPNGSQRHTPQPASGPSAPDRSMDDPWTSNEVLVRFEARTDRERRRSSAPDDLQEPRRQDETRRTVDLGHSSDGPSWIDLAEIHVNATESCFAAYLN